MHTDTNQSSPASNGSITYRAALADLFGRFGALMEFDVSPPGRPRPPVPTPQPHTVFDGPEGVGGPPASPGHVDVAVTVPAVANLAAGSLDIATAALNLRSVLRVLRT